jgi:hypothetical protein
VLILLWEKCKLAPPEFLGAQTNPADANRTPEEQIAAFGFVGDALLRLKAINDLHIEVLYSGIAG